jgi:transketolase
MWCSIQEGEVAPTMRNTVTSSRLRRIVLQESSRARVGHIGSALSIADILVALYGSALRIPSPRDPHRDRFVLSKGHAALALYGCLHLRGWLSADALSTYCTDDSLLGVHPERSLPGVDFSTGSLGHGLPFAVGAALAARFEASAYRSFVLVSDAECNEGSLWEAVMFAAHHQLANLVAIVDLNGQQAFGHTRDVLDLSPMADRWRAFGWDVHEVDGHDVDSLVQTIAGLDTRIGLPHVLIARTVFGKGVSFMERELKWHYLPMSNDEYRSALAEIDGES